MLNFLKEKVSGPLWAMWVIALLYFVSGILVGNALFNKSDPDPTPAPPALIEVSTPWGGLPVRGPEIYKDVR